MRLAKLVRRLNELPGLGVNGGAVEERLCIAMRLEVEESSTDQGKNEVAE